LDSFAFRVSDGELTSVPATVSLAIASENDAPIANNLTINLNEDNAAAITLTGSDSEGSPLNYTLVSQPEKGRLTGTAPGLTYTPNPNINGIDSFTFKVSDGVLSAIAIVTLNIAPVNDEPAAIAQNLTLEEDTSKSITLSGTDVEAATLSYAIVTPPAKGALSGTVPNLVYTPNVNANGSDSFAFQVNDGELSSGTATVTLNITALNDVPIALGQTINLKEDAISPITLTGSDSEGTPLTYSLVSQPAKGRLSGTAPDLSYAPNANVNGTDSFTFKVSDGVLSAIAIVTLEIAPVNDAPVAVGQNLDLDEDTTKSITLVGTDVEGTDLSFALVTAPAKGKLSGTLPNLVYTPNANAHGDDSFRFKVSDGGITSPEALVTLKIRPVNDAPLAQAQILSIDAGVPLDILLSATDVEDDQLTYTIITPPKHGSLIGSGARFVYTAANAGDDYFEFVASDPLAQSAPARINITAREVAFKGIKTTGSQMLFHVTAPRGSILILETSTNFVDWSVVTTHLATGASDEITAAMQSQLPSGFFRLRKEAAPP
jgi:hypothetical protein